MISFLMEGADDRILKVAEYLGENAIKSETEYFRTSFVIYPFIKIWAKWNGIKMVRCKMDVLEGMGMVV